MKFLKLSEHTFVNMDTIEAITFVRSADGKKIVRATLIRSGTKAPMVFEEDAEIDKVVRFLKLRGTVYTFPVKD